MLYFFLQIFSLSLYTEVNEVNSINPCDQTTNQLVFEQKNGRGNYIFYVLLTPRNCQFVSKCFLPLVYANY